MIKFRLILVAAFLALSPFSVWGQQITKELIVSDEKKRSFYLYVPETVKANPVPLVILLHGSNRVGLSLAEKWKDLAKKEGFIMAAPDSLNSASWAIPGDGPVFLRDLVDALKAKYPVNARRVYLFGHSAGAGFALLIGLYESEYFAAVAVHAGAIHPNSFDLITSAKRKIPIHIQVGTDDPLFPLPLVRKTRDELKAADFPAELKEIPNHDHWYYDRAREINATAWDFLKAKELSAAPAAETQNFRTIPRAESKEMTEALTHYKRGLELLKAEDWAGAVFAFTRVIELDGKDADAYNNRGVAQMKQNNSAEAVADFNRSIELKPNASAYSNRGGALFSQGKINEAIADFSEALKLKPSAEIYADRGLGYARQGKEDLARADYDRAIELNPKLGRSYVLRGLLALNKGQEDVAQKDFAIGFGLDPELHAEFDGVIQQIRAARGVK